MSFPDLSSHKGGHFDLKGGTFLSPMISGHKGDPNNPTILTNGTIINGVISGCSDLHLDGMTVRGEDGSVQTNQLTNKSIGLRVRSSQKVKVFNTELHHVFVGLVFEKSPDCVADANLIHDIRTDGIHYVGSQRLKITRQEITDWFPGIGGDGKPDHCDGIQGFNTTSDPVIEDVLIAQNCLHRGQGKDLSGASFAAMGINGRFYPDQKGWTRMQVAENLLIGMAHNAMEFNYDTLISDNVILSFTDVLSLILYMDTCVLQGNQAIRYAKNRKFQHDVSSGQSIVAPGNYVNAAIDASAETALVSEWKKKMLGSPAPDPTPTPTPDPDPTPVPVAILTDEQRDQVKAKIGEVLDTL